MIIVPLPQAGSTFQPSIVTPNTTDILVATSYTIVNKYRPIVIKKAGSVVRLTIDAALSGGGTIANTYIGLSAITGDAWDFRSTPTAVTWNGGNASLTLVAGKKYLSDEIDFVVDDTVPISVAYNINANSRVRYSSGLGTNYITYTKASVAEAGTVNKGTGYVATAGYNHFMSLLEVAD